MEAASQAQSQGRWGGQEEFPSSHTALVPTEALCSRQAELVALVPLWEVRSRQEQMVRVSQP